jgi:hypothetical protein
MGARRSRRGPPACRPAFAAQGRRPRYAQHRQELPQDLGIALVDEARERGHLVRSDATDVLERTPRVAAARLP